MLPKIPVRVLFGALFCWLLTGPLFSQDPAPVEEEGEEAEFVSDAPSTPTDLSPSASTDPSSITLAEDYSPGLEGESLLLPGGEQPTSRFKVDLLGSTSYIYDSNTTQSVNGTSASMFSFGLGASVRSSDPRERGGFYGLNYQGQYYLYDESADEFGRDPYEQSVGVFVGVNGAKTRIRLDVDYRANNGNSVEFDNVYRETRRAASDDYNVRLGISRDFYRGNLEFGAGYALRDFDEANGISDGLNSYGDVAWFTTPSFAPKSDMGLGLKFGTDDYQGQGLQDFVTPSYRWRYRLSGKTSIKNSFGYEFRSSEGPGARETQNLVYDGGIDWVLTPKTGFGLGYYRRVQPSFVTNQEDVTSTGVNLNLVNKLPMRFVLSTRVGFENAAYEPTNGGVPSGREDDFLKLAIDLSHPLMITERIRGEWGVFFHYNQNDSTLAPVEFDQNVAGIRVGLVY